MATRRTCLALAAGSVALAGCASPGGSSGTGLTVEAFDVTVTPGSDARLEVQATEVGGLTRRAGDIPQSW